MNNSTVLLIGGGKFIGRHIVARLLEDGYKVTMLTRGITPNPYEGRVEWLKCDRDNVEEFENLLHRRSFDYVIDLVCMNAEQASAAAGFFLGRTSRYIFISTGAVYLLDKDRINPMHEGDIPKLPPAPPHPGALVSYGYNKRAAEVEFEKAFAENGFPHVTIRPPVVSGPYDYTDRDYHYIFRVLDGGPLLIPLERQGSHRHCWVNDLVDAVILTLLTRDIAGRTFNIASGSILSLADYLSIVASAAGLPLKIRYLSYRLLEAELGGDFSPFAYPRDFIQEVYLARTVLGFKPTRAEKWLAALTRYIAEEYKGDPPADYARMRGRELSLAAETVGGEC